LVNTECVSRRDLLVNTERFKHVLFGVNIREHYSDVVQGQQQTFLVDDTNRLNCGDLVLNSFAVNLAMFNVLREGKFVTYRLELQDNLLHQLLNNLS